MGENITSEKCYLWSIPENVDENISSWIMRNNISLFPIKRTFRYFEIVLVESNGLQCAIIWKVESQ